MRWTLLILTTFLAAPAVLVDDDEGQVKLVLHRDHDYGSSDITSLEKAGIKVIEIRKRKRKVPSIYDIRSSLDSGVDVRVEAKDFASYDLKTLGGRDGKAIIVVRTTKHYASDLRDMVKKGACLEIRTDEYSVYDLKRMVGK